MADRQWYTGRDGKQEGPFSDERLRELIAAGTVTAETLVWSAGMTTWAKAAEIPGLMSAAQRGPSVAPGAVAGTAGAGPFSLDVRVWPLFWRGLVFGLSELAVIPLPWVAPIFMRWFVDRIAVPGQRRVSFVGKAEDIWWVFILYALCAVVGAVYSLVQVVVIPLSAYLVLRITRWFFANLTWAGQREPLQFTGGYWALLGWSVLLPCPSSPSSAGPGSPPPGRAGCAGTSRARRSNWSSPPAAGAICGVCWWWRSPPSFSSPFHGPCAGSRAGWSRNSRWWSVVSGTKQAMRFHLTLPLGPIVI